MADDNEAKKQIDGSTVFIALKDGVDEAGKPDVKGFLVTTPPGGSWTVSNESGEPSINPDHNGPQPETRMTSVNKLTAQDPALQALPRIDLRDGGAADFSKTATGFLVGGATPQQGLPLPDVEVQKVLTMALQNNAPKP
ncbi:MAG: hypothetical protein JWO78_1681 [Micavibrio sp.]|nr:hypothetical protein [Micavibrio sp.]